MSPHRVYVFKLVLSLALIAGCAAPSPQAVKKDAGALPDLGRHSFRITTTSPETQRCFNRGLTLAYSFGHFAAEKEFERALNADPACAMALWGIALVNGPHINFPLVPPEKAKKAWSALSQARALSVGTTPLEKALINALASRYADPQPEDRSKLDEAYAAAMQQLWHRYPTNADVGALCAEAAMDLHPWDLWKDGAAQPWTPAILENLEAVLKLDSTHPGANHLYIHAVEASPSPEKGLPAAQRLAHLVPDASHMVHMPAHIYARVGDWAAAAAANRQAMQADKLYRAAYPRPGFYNVYMAHNTHFLAFTAMMRGRRDECLDAARQMVNGIPDEFIKESADIVDGMTVFVSEALMRFGKWEEILAEPEPPEQLPLSRALWHFTRAAAYNGLDRTNEARAEQKKLEESGALVAKDARFGNNQAGDILQIAKLVLEGEMSARAGDLSTATAKLTEAMRKEDTLKYNEPPDWIQPVRHTLGAVKLRQGEAQPAEQIYREDLARYPENGWSLMGLKEALRQQGKTGEAELVEKKFKKAWADADVKPTVTCYCVAGR